MFLRRGNARRKLGPLTAKMQFDDVDDVDDVWIGIPDGQNQIAR